MRRAPEFDDASGLAIVGPLTDEALERIPASFHAWAESPAGEAFRFRRGSGSWIAVPRSQLHERVERSIVRRPDELSVREIEDLARVLPYDDFGVLLILSGRYVGVSLSHAFADGVTVVGPLRTILSGVPEVAPRRVRFPLLRVLAATGQLSLAGLRAGRDFQRSLNRYVAAAPLAAPGEIADAATLSLSHFGIDAVRLRAYAARVRHGGTTASTLDVVSSVVFRAFRACLVEGTDLPIRMLVGMRQHLPEGLSAGGSFFTSAVFGTLRDREWTPEEVGEAMRAVTASPVLVASHAVNVLLGARERVRRRLSRSAAAEPSGSPLMLNYNVLTGRIGVARKDFVPGKPTTSALMMLNRGTLIGPHCTVMFTGTEVLVTTVDYGDLLDLARFEAALDAELDG